MWRSRYRAEERRLFIVRPGVITILVFLATNIRFAFMLAVTGMMNGL